MFQFSRIGVMAAVLAGAFAVAAPVASAQEHDRSFWLCYSIFQTDPAPYSRSDALANRAAGRTVPFAVPDPLSRTRLANGLYLVCNLPAGYTVRNGVAVSTGSGEIFTEPPDFLSFLLGSMPLDYTRLATRI